MLYIGMMPTA